MSMVPSLRNSCSKWQLLVTRSSFLAIWPFTQKANKCNNIFFFQLLTLASNCCLTSNKSLCLNHKGKRYQRTGHHLAIQEALEICCPWKYITSTLTVPAVTGHYKMFFAGQFNKRVLCYKILKRDRIYGRGVCLQRTQHCIADLALLTSHPK